MPAFPESLPSPANGRKAPPRATRLLVVSPDAQLCALVERLFPELERDAALDLEALTRAVDHALPDAVLFDLRCLPESDATGLSEWVGRLQASSPSIKVIAIVGEGRRDQAAAAISAGAADFYHLPLDAAVLPLLVRRALRVRELELENQQLRDHGAATSDRLGLVGQSKSIRGTLRTIEKVAPTNATVLLLGESGTGKELLARALHRLSARAERPFCAINCAAIPENLLESELFGHEKGAFTGAVKQTQGRLELAEGGTVFLDEIGEMAPSLQAKLLRMIQERVVERVGGRTSIPLDIRIICATHRDLQGMLGSHRFREDLYYRISEVTVNIPPLREREGDAVLLAKFFLRASVQRHGRRIRGLSAGAIQAIQSYGWPGNVRELENRINAGVIMAEGSLLSAADLGLESAVEQGTPPLREVRRRAERLALDQALTAASGNLTRASEILGVTRPTLYDLIARHGVDASRFAADAASVGRDS